jgi:hypothetical protein
MAKKSPQLKTPANVHSSRSPTRVTVTVSYQLPPPAQEPEKKPSQTSGMSQQFGAAVVVVVVVVVVVPKSHGVSAVSQEPVPSYAGSEQGHCTAQVDETRFQPLPVQCQWQLPVQWFGSGVVVVDGGVQGGSVVPPGGGGGGAVVGE